MFMIAMIAIVSFISMVSFCKDNDISPCQANAKGVFRLAFRMKRRRARHPEVSAAPI